LEGSVRLKGERFFIPGDISKAAYLIVAAALARRGELYLQDVGINPSRTAFLHVLELMGAKLQKINEREENCEPVADLLVKGGRSLKGTEISAAMLPRLSDELPALIVAALFAQGDTLIQGISALVPEKLSRLQNLYLELQKMGAQLAQLENGLLIKGGAKLDGAQCESHSDPSIAMALATAALFAGRPSVIHGAEGVQASFPGFFDEMNKLAS
jgi:3-phosphoshikimate 1-carboxyvinyltransferase